MDKIDQQTAPKIVEGNISLLSSSNISQISPEEVPQELDYWAVEDFEDLLPPCAE